jgi:hypothetical protein
MSITELLPDRFGHALFAVWIVLFAIDVFLPRTRRSVISLYDAGMFAIIVVLLAWGVLIPILKLNDRCRPTPGARLT